MGRTGLAAVLKYAIELGAYNKMKGIAPNDIFKPSKDKFKNNIFRQIHLNFISKMNEINEMKELMRLMLENKLTLLKNIFNETNFKVKIDLGQE